MQTAFIRFTFKNEIVYLTVSIIALRFKITNLNSNHKITQTCLLFHHFMDFFFLISGECTHKLVIFILHILIVVVRLQKQ